MNAVGAIETASRVSDGHLAAGHVHKVGPMPETSLSASGPMLAIAACCAQSPLLVRQPLQSGIGRRPLVRCAVAQANIIRDFLQEALPLLQPATECFDETLKTFAAFQLG